MSSTGAVSAEGKDFWDSRTAFWLAAVGSAVGLGNIWRFPWRVNQGGGAAFLIAYFVSLFLIGMPLLTQEMALGQYFRGGDVEAYGRIHPRLRGIGLASVVGAYAICCYYVVIISYAVFYAGSAMFSNPLPWISSKIATQTLISIGMFKGLKGLDIGYLNRAGELLNDAQCVPTYEFQEVATVDKVNATSGTNYRVIDEAQYTAMDFHRSCGDVAYLAQDFFMEGPADVDAFLGTPAPTFTAMKNDGRLNLDGNLNIRITQLSTKKTLLPMGDEYPGIRTLGYFKDAMLSRDEIGTSLKAALDAASGTGSGALADDTMMEFGMTLCCKEEVMEDVDPGTFFFEKTLQIKSLGDGGKTRFSWELWGCVVFVWVSIYLCIFNGVVSVSKAVMISMPVPILFLVIMLIKGLTLEGAGDGIRAYTWQVQWETLGTSTLWTSAIAQMFFSLSVCMGVMTAYASSTPAEQSIVKDEKVVAFADVMIAYCSGFVIYSVLGHMSAIYPMDHDGKPIDWYSQASMGLVFIAYPQALAEFKGAGAFSAIFFSTLFLLGIDSAFSMVEAFSCAVLDSDWAKRDGREPKKLRPKLNFILCLFGLLMSTLFCFDTGLNWLDVLDYYINSYGMLMVGGLECIALGWFWKTEVGARVVGETAMNTWTLMYWTGVVMGTCMGLSNATPIAVDGADCDQFQGGLGGAAMVPGLLTMMLVWIIGMLLALTNSYVFEPDTAKCTNYQRFKAIINPHGPNDIRQYLNRKTMADFQVGNWEHEKKGYYTSGVLTFQWGFLIKYFIPTLLTILLADTMRKDSFAAGYYCGSSQPFRFQLLGIFVYIIMFLTVIYVAIKPESMAQDYDKKRGTTGKSGEEVELSGMTYQPDE